MADESDTMINEAETMQTMIDEAENMIAEADTMIDEPDAMFNEAMPIVWDKLLIESFDEAEIAFTVKQKKQKKGRGNRGSDGGGGKIVTDGSGGSYFELKKDSTSVSESIETSGYSDLKVDFDYFTTTKVDENEYFCIEWGVVVDETSEPDPSIWEEAGCVAMQYEWETSSIEWNIGSDVDTIKIRLNAGFNKNNERVFIDSLIVKGLNQDPMRE
jgi:hypothetical protein